MRDAAALDLVLLVSDGLYYNNALSGTAVAGPIPHGAGLDELIGKVDILANRLVVGLLIAALVLGSSVLGIFVEGGVRILGVSILGLAGFLFAATLALVLLVGIIRSGRL